MDHRNSDASRERPGYRRWFGRAVLLAAIVLSAPAFADGDRVALVVGNSAYQHMPVLANPGADARAVADVLSQLGFENGKVRALLDLDLRTLLQAVRTFGERARDARIAVVYFSGHGIQLGQGDGTESYLLPVDADLGDARDVPRQTLPLHELLGEAGHSQGGVVVLLDACRNNPAVTHMAGAGTRGATRSGLIPIAQGSLPVGALVSYATSGGDAAEDGTGRHSPYAAALIKYLPMPGHDVAQVLRRVRGDVLETTGGKQRPEIVDNLNCDVFLVSLPDPAAPAPPPGPAADPLAAETALWGAVHDSSRTEDLEAYLRRFPQGLYADLARNRLAALVQPAVAPIIVPTPVSPATPPEIRPPPSVEGKVTRVGDANAFMIGDRIINLYGITGPSDDKEVIAKIQQVMKQQLAALGGVVKCYSRDKNTHECYAQDQDFAEVELRIGIARVKPGAPAKYRDAEQDAKKSHRGIWNGPGTIGLTAMLNGDK